ncbi:polyketide cyclase [Chryseobacterium sp.]|uniref:SRPBCC family protein n=1 Tax=Chryseobacterium sp. TaxID=1871047 RepID=UPI001B0967C1|nr:polyketide cyclase [Chryseobacterium sp.]MBO9691707.1 SRPBCC domain-containing protein [Chryseobacterium sp.]
MKHRAVSVTSNLIGKKEVWELITDIDHWNKWDFNIERSENRETKVGKLSSFVLKHRNFLTARGVVEEFIPYENFTFRIRLAGAKLYRKYTMEETKDGLKITIITSVSGFLAGLWYLLAVKKIVNDTPEDLTIIVEQIKNRNEKQCTF